MFAEGELCADEIPAAAIVTVVIPADPVLTVAPEKLTAVRDVPTEVPPDLTSIPETTPVKFDPSPK